MQAAPAAETEAGSPGGTYTRLAAPAAVSRSGDELLRLINKAADGATIQLKGTYTAAVGTTYVVNRRINLVGSGAVLVNIRLIFLADVSLSGIEFVEQDCNFYISDPQACSPASPLVTIGYAGYPIQSATVRNVSMRFGRAYTGIAFGLGPITNVTIDGFSIVDNEMSGITALGGQNITISNGTIVGGSQKNVDDGIALYSVYGELRDVTVQNVRAQNTFDLVGIGALMYYPIQNIQVTNSQCEVTAVCVYVKSGDQSPLPAGVTGYSRLSHVRISGLTDTDSSGSRYLSSIWLVGAGGASAEDITVDHMTTRSRPSTAPTARIKIFTDAKSKLSGIVLSNLDLRDPTVPTKAGWMATEGVFVQDMGWRNISNVTLTNVSIDGASMYAIDSNTAVVDLLSINACSFTNMNVNSPGAPLFLIPYSYQMNGSLVSY